MKASLLLFSLFLATAAGAQLTLKPKAGVTLSRFQRVPASYPAPGNDQYLAGLHGGVAVTYTKQRVSVQGEILYNSEGTQYLMPQFRIGGAEPEERWYAYRFRYLELPVLAYYRLVGGLHAGAGGYYAHLLQGDFLEDAKPKNHPFVSYSRADFGLLAELAYRHRRFEIGARYRLGLKPVQQIVTVPNDPEFAPQAPTDLGRNRSLQLSVSIPVRL